MGRLAILAGQGTLPLELAKAHPDALFVSFEGLDVERPSNAHVELSYERFGEIFDRLCSFSCDQVVFAGGLARPSLNPANFDAKMLEIAPRLLAAMQGGDDGLLTTVIDAFEEHGFQVRGAHELLDGLTAKPGLLAGSEPSKADRDDIARARAVLAALGPLDVGQGAVASAGQMIGVETLQGTDAMLRFVAESRRGKGGVLVKCPKQGQDLRVDMPALGPNTVFEAQRAGLSGIAFDAERVLLLDRGKLVDAAKEAGLFLLAEAP